MIPAQRSNLLAPPDTAAILASFRAGTFGEAQLATLLANYEAVQKIALGAGYTDKGETHFNGEGYVTVPPHKD